MTEKKSLHAERNNIWKKRFDFYLGAPILFFLGLFRKKRVKPNLNEEKNFRFALLKTAALGDTILTTAIIQEIRAQFHTAEIVFVCSKANLAMAKTLLNNGVDEIFCFEMNSPVRSLFACRKFSEFDFVFDFSSWNHINALIAYFLPARYKIGFYRRKKFRHYIFDEAVEHLDSVHEVENFRNILRASGMKLKNFAPKLSVQTKKFFEGEYFIFHLFVAGSSKKLREWDVKNWQALAEKIFLNYKEKIFFTGSPSEKFLLDELVEDLRKKNISAENIAGKFSLEELPTILSQARCLVSVDTGIMHMGAAAGAKIVALHGATSPDRWGACTKKVISVSANEPCQPCVSLGFESKCQNPICMKKISVDMVFHAIEKILE